MPSADFGDVRPGPGRPGVAVTGIGMRTPIGSTREEVWAQLVKGESVAQRDDELVAADVPVRFACRVKDFEPTDHLGQKEARRLDRAVQLGICAGLDALADAGSPSADPARCAVVAATGIGPIGMAERQFQAFQERGPRGIAPLMVPASMSNTVAAHLSILCGWTGPSSCVVTACTSGAQAIGEGAELIRRGVADVVLAGGFEAPITPFNVSAFWRVAALSTRNDDPLRASRPFDAARDGFVMGEGVGFLLLERLEHAAGRGAERYGELIGFGWNSDAHHITAPSPEGRGAAACMRLALEDAGLDASDIVHVNAHGTSTRANDLLEARAIHDVFGASGPPVTASKGIFGHLVGAAGAVEAVATLLSMNAGEVPPIANCEALDPGVDIDAVRDQPRSITRGPAISNSFGFGGHNAALIFSPSGEQPE